jgi:hypothetical protein
MNTSYVLEVLTVLTDARYLHRIPKIAASPTDAKLDFVPNNHNRKRRRRKPMDRLINKNGQYIRVDGTA